MELIFSGSVAKDKYRKHENEDVFEIDFINHGLRVALSDGATISYDSKGWAKTIAEHFIKNGKFSEFDIRKIIKEYYSERFSFKNLTHTQKLGLKYGSFATVLGIEYSFLDGEIDVFGVGDSTAVLLEGNKFAEAFPYSKSAEFDKSPQMLSTRKRNNLFFSDSNRTHFNKIWTLEKYTKPALLCMSDALAEFALKEEENGNSGVWEKMLNIKNITEFRQFVQKKRENRSLKIDDTTLISLRLKV